VAIKNTRVVLTRQGNYIYKCLLCSILDELSRRKDFGETSEKENTTTLGKNVLEFVNELIDTYQHEVNKSVIDELTKQYRYCKSMDIAERIVQEKSLSIVTIISRR